MRSKTIILEQIQTVTKGQATCWQIGITHDPALRRSQTGNPLDWLHWKTNSPDDARYIAQSMQSQGLQTDRLEISKAADYVYILLADQPHPDTVVARGSVSLLHSDMKKTRM